jgi:hypothetical protein
MFLDAMATPYPMYFACGLFVLMGMGLVWLAFRPDETKRADPETKRPEPETKPASREPRSIPMACVVRPVGERTMDLISLN